MEAETDRPSSNIFNIIREWRALLLWDIFHGVKRGVLKKLLFPKMHLPKDKCF